MSENEPYVYIPSDTEINNSNLSSEPPKTRYNKRQVVFNRKIVKDKVTKGRDITNEQFKPTTPRFR